MVCGKTGKVAHATREGAMITRKRQGKVLSAYRCSHCKQWHLGNTRNTRLANMNRLFDRVAARRLTDG